MRGAGEQCRQVGRERVVQHWESQQTQRLAARFLEGSCNVRGQEHRIRMTEAPGAMVTVNRQGEPRMR